MLGTIAEAAEGAEATKLSVMDHYFQMAALDAPTEPDMLESYAALSCLAARASA